MPAMHWAKAAFALFVIFAGVIEQPPARAREPERSDGTAEASAAGVRVEILRLKRRDGSTLTLRVAAADSSAGQANNSGLLNKD